MVFHLLNVKLLLRTRKEKKKGGEHTHTNTHMRNKLQVLQNSTNYIIVYFCCGSYVRSRVWPSLRSTSSFLLVETRVTGLLLQEPSRQEVIRGLEFFNWSENLGPTTYIFQDPRDHVDFRPILIRESINTDNNVDLKLKTCKF